MNLDIQKPRHIVITPDGNRRWAKERGLPTITGHIAGHEKIKEIIGWANEKVIECITVWGLSKENVLERDKNEIKGILKLVNQLPKLLPFLLKNNARFINIGDMSVFPEETQVLLNEIQENTKNNTGMKLVIALAYSGLDEIIRTNKKLNRAGLDIDDINEIKFKEFLDGGLDIPDPDLNIRTGIHNGTNCTRHSGIYLARATSTEYLSHKTLWPDYTEEQFELDLIEFNKTKRTKGK